MKVRTTSSGFLLFVLCILTWQLVSVRQAQAQGEGRETSAQVTGSAAPGSRNDIVPLVDYHVHLLGPYALPAPDPLPPEVKVPAELDRLLAELANLIGNVTTGPISRMSSLKMRNF